MSHAEDVHNARQWGGYGSKTDAQKRHGYALANAETWRDTIREREAIAAELGTERARVYVEVARLELRRAEEVAALYAKAVLL